MLNGLTVDVEDYFQVSAFENHIDRSQWETLPCRVERNVERILDVFSEHGVKATFFTLAWVAERYPNLVRRIVDEGHELASHGCEHVRVTEQSREVFYEDVVRAKAVLEDASGTEVQGYRAASYSIGESNLWALDTLLEAGYHYSSSIYPVRHDLYGMPNAPRFPFRHRETGLLEIPMSTLRLMDRNFPCGGGGYFRLFPYFISSWAIRRVNRDDGQPCLFYFHPWEIDPEQPRQRGLPMKTRVRHYLNLKRTEQRLRKLLRDFSWDRIDRVFADELAEQRRE